MLRQYSEQQSRKRKEEILFKNRAEVGINDNGTSGYMVKNGANKDKVLGHRSIKTNNNW
jgi:hypothetical protein